MSAAAIGSYAAKKKASGMLAPLLDDEDSSASSDDTGSSSGSDKVEFEKKSPMEKLKSAAVFAGLGLGLVASAGAMVIAPAVPIFVMGGLALANIPYAAFKERSIGKIPTLRSMNLKLKESANSLEEEVDTLSGEIDALVPNANRAAAVEEELRDIADQQQFNADRLLELVKENGAILRKMRENVRQRILQDIINIVVKSDRDNNQTIDEKEAKALALSIRLQLQEYNVYFDGNKFLKAIGKDPTVPSVIRMIQQLLLRSRNGEDDPPDDSNDDDSVFDMFHLGLKEEGGERELSKSILRCDSQGTENRIRMAFGMNELDSSYEFDSSCGSDEDNTGSSCDEETIPRSEKNNERRKSTTSLPAQQGGKGEKKTRATIFF